MKTKNNVQKTILNPLAVIVSLLMLSYTVTARDFWKMVIENSSFNQIALAVADTHSKPRTEPVNEETWVEKMMPANEMEPEMKVENWMKNTNRFESASLLPETAVEQPLEIENWMKDAGHFEKTAESEETLAVEPWMTNDKLWTR